MGKVKIKSGSEVKKELANRNKRRIRFRRDRILSRTDWTTLPDSPLSDKNKEKAKEYRQKLRDITSQKGFPDEVKWPDPPSFLKDDVGE